MIPLSWLCVRPLKFEGMICMRWTYQPAICTARFLFLKVWMEYGGSARRGVQEQCFPNVHGV